MPAGLDGNPDPIRSPERDTVLAAVAAAVLAVRRTAACTLIAIDGISGAGKSTFAEEVARVLGVDGVPVIRSTTDSFHRPRAARWARGKTSPDGYYLDSFDLATMRRVLLDPLSAQPSEPYRAAAFDEPTDSPVEAPIERAEPGSVLLFDGLFLQRPELRGYWDLVVWLGGEARVDARRLTWAVEGCPPGVGALPHLVDRWSLLARYHLGTRRYLDECDPIAHADIVIANDDLAAPSVMSGA